MKSSAGHNFISDWLMVPDSDEFLYHPNMRLLLESYMRRGVMLAQTQGYMMVGDGLLVDGLITDQIKTGVPDALWSKPIIYRGGLTLTYRPGAHEVKAPNAPRSQTADIKMLHYKFAFGWAWVEQRVRQRRLCAEDVERGWGYGADVELHRQQFEDHLARRVMVL